MQGNSKETIKGEWRYPPLLLAFLPDSVRLRAAPWILPRALEIEELQALSTG